MFKRFHQDDSKHKHRDNAASVQRESSLRSIIIIPHFKPQGGAGIYIQRVIREVGKHARTVVEGRYGSLYDGYCPSPFKNNIPNLATIPLYEGVRLSSFLWRAVVLPYNLYRVLRWIIVHKYELSKYDTIIFTSSVDLVHTALIKAIVKDISVICIIQENLVMRGIRGRIARALIAVNDLNIVITHECAETLAQFNLRSVLVPNPFIEKSRIECDNLPKSTDILFVGGDQKIKGFDFLLKLLRQISNIRPVKVQILGDIRRKSRKVIENLNAEIGPLGSEIECHGFINDTEEFYSRAKVLLLPITHAHFCRPAVEAGLAKCTFVVSELEGLGDFAKFGYNCLAAAEGDINAWLHQVTFLLENDNERDVLANKNYCFAKENFINSDFEFAFKKISKGGISYSNHGSTRL